MSQSVTPATGLKAVFETPHWLQNHQPGHRVDLTKTEIQDLLAAARRSLEVAGEKVAAALLAKYLAGYPMPENFERDIAPLYLETLADLPADLLQQGLINVRKTHSYNSLPKEADIRKSVEQDLAERRAAVRKLEAILQVGKFHEPPPRKRTPEEQAYGIEQFAKIKAILADTTEGLKR